MFKKTLLLLFSLFCLAYVNAQTVDKKSYEATRIETKPVIDGSLNDEAWLRIGATAKDFVQREPNLGKLSNYKTEVKIGYDDEAIYIGAVLYDDNRDSILKQLTARDKIGNTDWFGIVLDTYEDGNNGVGFIVSAAGVQFDTKYSVFGEDENWNAVWESAVLIVERGWIVEMKIPYAALRFPDKREQVWNLNIVRTVRRTRENSWWNFFDPSQNGFLNQAGKLKGIKDVVSPIRLFLNPYISGNVKNTTTDGENSISRGFNVGMDLKYGINEAYTLDMTLVPDFGQVVSDDVVLNLSPFEVQFNENRQFFTEGTELFQKANLFYSRRIGGTPNGYHDVQALQEQGYTIDDNPNDIQLINSTKVSGRGKKGLGVGVFNSVTNRTTAMVTDSNGVKSTIQTSPLTNYNVFVLDQNFKNNSYLSVINTNVYRNGDAYEANVTGTEFRFNNKKNTYYTYGNGAVSQLYKEGLSSPDLGFRSNVGFGKSSGTVQFEYESIILSDTYDNNDLGFLRSNNEINNSFLIGLNRFKPFGPFLRGNINLSTSMSHQYSTKRFANFGVNLNFFTMTKQFFAFGGGTFISPLETYNLFELRTENRVLAIPRNREHWAWISTDYRNKFAIDINVNGSVVNQEGRNRLGVRVGPILRINDRLSFKLSTNYSKTNNYIGFVGRDTIPLFLEEPIVGRRDNINIENVLSSSYIFNNKMGLTLRMRHNWTEATHDKYYYVDVEGHLLDTDLTGFNDDGSSKYNYNFNYFSLDLVYTWQFAPGSFLTANWKNNIIPNNIGPGENYFYNLRNTVTNDQTNILSVKIIYFLDYLSIEQMMRREG
ncbi:MAG: hypothetical protein ACJAUH_002030 [Saprospiraceae bacterium]|jgi:hypothetical protein